MKTFKKVARVAIPLALVVLPFLVLAQQLPQPSPGIGGRPITLREVEDIINLIARFLIVIGVVIAVIFIIWGGIGLMYAGGDEKKHASAVKRLKYGVLGALVVLAVGVILQTLSSLVARTFFS